MAWQVPETYSCQVGGNRNSVPGGKGNPVCFEGKRDLWSCDVKRKNEK